MEKIYKCDLCNFTTNDRTTLYNHNKSKKHLKKKEEFKNNYDDENVKLNNIINLKDQEIEKLKIEIEKLKMENEKLKEEKMNTEALVKAYEKIYIKPKYKKESIPKTLKIAVWNKYFGEATGKIKCPCCNITEITQLKFHCGHIIAEKNGGTLNINNLMPICESCNKSMGTQNLHEFRKKIQEIIE
jgi:5-methylcytosine-specific restriction endonuclease McrA